MSVKTPDQFFELLEKSNILPDAKLARAKESAQGVGSVKDVARRLIKADLLTKWQAANLLAGKSKLTIGKYRLLGQIGGASTGNVFLAEHAQMNRRVALKALVHRDHSPESTQAFLKQARAVSSLEHPHLTRAYDIDIQDQYYYLVMEHVQGRTVDKVLEEEGPFDPQLAAKYMRQAADALDYAHGKGLLHRDIRPTNLMLGNNGELKVLNLGVVKLSDPSDPPVADSTDAASIEHAAYLSPEQARGSENIDARSDIYSLGCVMFAMLTGQPPLDGKTYGEIIKNHQTAAPKKILDLKPDLPRDLAKICLKMLGKKREDRFQTAGQIVKFLDKWLADNQPVSVEKPPVAIASRADATPVEPLEVVSTNKPPVAIGQVSQPQSAQPQAEDFAVAVAEAPAPAVGGFAIDTEPRGRRRKKPAATATAGAASEGKVAVAGNSHKTLIIGGAIGGGVLVLAALVLIVMFVLPGGNDDIAQVDPGQDPAAAPATDSAHPATEIGEPEPETADPAAPANGAEANPPEPAAEEAAPAESEPDELLSLIAKPEKEQPAEDPEPAAEEPAEDPPAEQPEQTPAIVQSDDPPAETAPADNKPKRTPAQAKEPLKQLVERIDLPPLELARGTEPAVGVGATASLGKVFDETDEAVFVELLGADQIARGTITYEVERELASALENRKWTVVLTNEREGEPSTPIAEFAIQDFDLSFRWLEGAAASVRDANAIRNCMLLVIIGKEEKAVALRTPQVLEPIAVNLTGRPARGQVEIDNIPEKENLQVQITKVEGFPQKVSLPPTPFPADGGMGSIAIGEPGQEPLQFQMRVNMTGRRPSLSVSPFYKLTGMQGYEPYSPVKLQQAYAFVVNQQNAATEFLRQQNIPQQAKAQAEQAISIANAALPEMNAIKSYEEALAESGKIHYSVIYTIGTHQMVIATTQAP